jgi:hypothetical protein
VGPGKRGAYIGSLQKGKLGARGGREVVSRSRVAEERDASPNAPHLAGVQDARPGGSKDGPPRSPAQDRAGADVSTLPFRHPRSRA